MNFESNAEYVAFGPWVIEFYEPQMLPNLFADKVNMMLKYDFLIKIPIEVERRKVSQGTDMYHTVIGISEGWMYIYENKDNKIVETQFRLADIQGIICESNLLLGNITCIFLEQEKTISYNTISETIMQKMIHLIRNSWQALRSFDIYNILSTETLSKLEFYYGNRFRTMQQADPMIQIIGLQDTQPVTLDNQPFYERILQQNNNLELTSCLYLSSNKELIIIKKSKNFVRSGVADYSHGISYLPYENFKTVLMENYSDSTEIKEVSIYIGKKPVKMLFKENNAYLHGFYSFLKGFNI